MNPNNDFALSNLSLFHLYSGDGVDGSNNGNDQILGMTNPKLVPLMILLVMMAIVIMMLVLMTVAVPIIIIINMMWIMVIVMVIII